MVVPTKRRSTWLRYGLAVALPCIGFLATYLIFHLGRTSYFTLFITSVVISSLFGGFGPGLVDTALSAILAFVVAPPAWTLRLSEPEEGIHVALFAVLGCLLSSIIGLVGELQRKSDRECLTLATALRSIGEAVITADNDGRITFFNKVAEQATGWNFTEAHGKPIGEIFRVVHATTRSVSLDPLQLALASSSASGLSNSGMLIRRDGVEIAIDITAALIRDDDRKITGFVLCFRDVTHQRALAEKMSHLAHHDPVTGLPNRQLFNDRLAQALNAARRHREKLAVIFVDLDNSKSVNDTLGHAVGDALLKAVANSLVACLRNNDTVSRHGGDEFVILLPGIKDTSGAIRKIQKIAASAENVHRIGPHDLQVTTSMGISMYPEHGQTAEVLLTKADAAMYRAKSGRGTKCEFASY